MAEIHEHIDGVIKSAHGEMNTNPGAGLTQVVGDAIAEVKKQTVPQTPDGDDMARIDSQHRGDNPGHCRGVHRDDLKTVGEINRRNEARLNREALDAVTAGARKPETKRKTTIRL